MGIESILDRERDEIAALFEEDVELGLYGLDREATFRITSVNGNPPQHRILVMYYNDEVYLPIDSRSNTNRLTVSDLDFCVRYGEVGNHANIEMRIQHLGQEVMKYDETKVIPSGTKVSLTDLLTRSYQLGGYGNRHELLNSNEITKEQARSIALEALGIPNLGSEDGELVSVKSAAKECREASEALNDNMEHDGNGRDAR